MQQQQQQAIRPIPSLMDQNISSFGITSVHQAQAMPPTAMKTAVQQHADNNGQQLIFKAKDTNLDTWQTTQAKQPMASPTGLGLYTILLISCLTHCSIQIGLLSCL
jgi:hypothetical protein